MDSIGKRVPLGAGIRNQEFVEPEVRQRDTHRRREPRRVHPFALDADAAAAFENCCSQGRVLTAGSQQVAACCQRVETDLDAGGSVPRLMSGPVGNGSGLNASKDYSIIL